MLRRTCLPLAVSCLFAVPTVVAAPIAFENFTPLAASIAVNALPEATPFRLANPIWSQRTIDANAPTGSPARRGDNWDMNTFNENGPVAGRYLFTPYETGGTAGVKRYDIVTGTSITLLPGGIPAGNPFVVGDASRWTPWGSYLTAEESWGTGSTKGRLFEITNPLADPAAVNFVQRTVIPRVSHEGLAFDRGRNLYFVDEANSAIYKFVSANPNATNGNDYFAAGQTFALKIGNGATPEATGIATWVPITNATGGVLPGVSVLAADGTIDGRASAVAVGATKYDRPEDLEIQTLANGDQILYVATTTNHKTFSIHLKDANPEVKLFASRGTTNAASGLAVGTPFSNPDNLAIDANGNIYIIEDQPGGSADIWFARDADRDGIAESLARWATMSTAGAEPTGLYFSPFDSNIAYVNVQHANSDIDRLIEIRAVPEPGALALLGLGVLGLGLSRRRRSTTAA